jgi:hypothetical protein
VADVTEKYADYPQDLHTFSCVCLKKYMLLIHYQPHSLISLRFPAGSQLLTKLVTGPMACGAVMVPTTMFMGQVVTAFAPQQGQTQTISIAQQQEQQAQSQAEATQQGLAQQQTQFLQVR